MEISKCSVRDVPRLAAMNKCLIDDEKSSNPMNTGELEKRMEEFILGDYDAYFFRDNGTVIGYALVRRSPKPVYLRQFFIDRNCRRKHLGKEAFAELMNVLQADEISIDVLPWNKAGVLFWKSLGFSETCISMTYRRQPDQVDTKEADHGHFF